jgi:hypothetical protein
MAACLALPTPVKNAPRLARTYPKVPLESDRLAQFHRFVVEETLPVGPQAEARAAPWMFDIMRDFGAIEPHPDLILRSHQRVGRVRRARPQRPIVEAE